MKVFQKIFYSEILFRYNEIDTKYQIKLSKVYKIVVAFTKYYNNVTPTIQIHFINSIAIPTSIFLASYMLQVIAFDLNHLLCDMCKVEVKKPVSVIRCCRCCYFKEKRRSKKKQKKKTF